MKTSQTQLKWSALLYLILAAAAFYQYTQQVHSKDPVKPYTKFWYAEMAGWAMVAVLALIVVALWLGQAERVIGWSQRWQAWIGPRRGLMWLLGAGAFLLFPIAVGVGGRFLNNFFPRFWIFATALAVLAWLMAALDPERTPWQNGLVAAFAASFSFWVATFIPQVSDFPFSLEWSEVSRFYHASLWFDQSVYGLDLPWPHRDFSRYLMQAVPYAIPDSPLWLHRAWQAAMRAFLPILTTWLLANRLEINDSWRKWVFVFWASFFLAQGPIFYPMLALIILILWGYDSQRLGWSTGVILVTAVWGGITRLNWMPMPGLLAATLYLMEVPQPGKNLKEWAKYAAPPVAWTVLSTAIGYGVETWYKANSGLPTAMFETTFSSDLLWDRLWPGPTYPLGMVPGTALILAPVLVMVVWRMAQGWRQWHWVRLVGLVGIQAGLFVGGLVVSVKIGAGTNLHNMDVFLIVFLMLAAYLFFDKFAPTEGDLPAVRFPSWLVAATLIWPMAFLFNFSRDLSPPDFTNADDTMDKLQIEIAQVDGEVLFISQRHLLTFDHFPDVDLAPEYEQIVLMEMVLGRNETYLNAFYTDLETNRFDIIITDKLSLSLKEVGVDGLAEENNIYTEAVTWPLVCYYEALDILIGRNIQVWVPRAEPCANPSAPFG